MHPDKGLRKRSRGRAAGMPLQIAAKMTELAERQYFVDRVEPLLGGEIEFVGELGRVEKYDFLKDAVCLLNPIRWDEPFGMVMIEAMACGTPVIANNRGSVSEIIDDGDTGFICHDEASLVASLRKVTTLNRSHCRVAVEQRFSSQRMARDHIDLYRRIISGEVDPPNANRPRATGYPSPGFGREQHSHRSMKVPESAPT